MHEEADYIIAGAESQAEERIRLGIIRPHGNPSYLAHAAGADHAVEPWRPGMPPSRFPCPICAGTATATAHAEMPGPMAIACDGACDAKALAARCRSIAPHAFAYSDNAITPIPPEIEAALIARGTDGAFTAGHEVAMRVIDKARRGATALTFTRVTSLADDTAFLVMRADYMRDGIASKELCQFHAARDIDGRIEIELGLPDGPWPLVGTAGLAGKTQALLVEGEKTMAAVSAMPAFADHAVLTSLGGCDSAHMSDWSTLKGMVVSILPDNDETGSAYACAAAAQIIAAGGTPRLARLPAGLPPKWDAADPLPPGVTIDDIARAVASAAVITWDEVSDAYRNRAAVNIRPPFRLADGHLAKVKSVVDGLPEMLAEISSGCPKPQWLRVIGGIHHAIGETVGRPIAEAWSRQDAETHGKFDARDWPGVYDEIVAAPPAHPMSLKSMIYEAMQQSKVRAEAADRGNSSGWTPGDTFQAEANLADIESRHRAVLRGDGIEVAVQKRRPDGSYYIDMLSQKAAEATYRAQKTYDHAGKPAKMLNFWLDNQRLPVQKAVFRPGRAVAADEYNLFRELDVQPVLGAGSYRLFRELLGRVSKDNLDESDFLWNLIAWRLQNCHTFVPSALIFVGPEGGFKTTITGGIGRLLAPYSLTVSEPGKFVGKFNAQLFGKLFVQVEETSLGRDQTIDSRLKHFINGEQLDLEEKGQPHFSTPNLLFTCITSNSTDVVRISPSSRRYGCYRVNDPFDGDEAKRGAHYLKLDAELRAGGLQAMMYDLLHTDLSNFNPRLCPRTPLFYELAGIALDRTPHVAWWQEILEKGELPAPDRVPSEWTADILVETLYGNYLGFCERNGPTTKARTLSISAWGKEFAKMVPKLAKVRLGPPSRKAVYRLPTYEECCVAFDKAFKMKVERFVLPGQMPEPF